MRNSISLTQIGYVQRYNGLHLAVGLENVVVPSMFWNEGDRVKVTILVEFNPKEKTS